jgi:phage gp36-like protein
MTYASQQTLIDRFGEDELIQLTDRANLGAIDATVVARALADADAEINGYLSTRYTLPLSPVPAVLEKLACDIARYQLFENAVTEIVKERYENAIRFLKDVAAGKVTLGVDGNGDTAATISNSVQMSSTTPVFRRSESDGFL